MTRPALTEKVYWRGTHRTTVPGDTLKRFSRFAAAFGITRLANVTGLDHLGIPVFMAVRPNSRSLSVSQGKGLDEESAAASAFMEAAELAHAERPRLKKHFGSYTALKARAAVVDLARLSRVNGAVAAQTATLAWVEGVDLAARSPIFVPFDLVDADFRRARDRSIFYRSSNGLASGNHWLEAVCAAVCEVIERDATALWRCWTVEQKAARRLVLASVQDRDCRALLDQLGDRGIAMAVWDITSDIGVACFVCRIDDSPQARRGPLGTFWGAGCHLSREVALTRAVTEAAQSRLTYIVGSRDDITRDEYDRHDPPAVFERVLDDWEQRQSHHMFKDVPSAAGATFEHDVAQLLARLAAVGLDQVIAVDLADSGIGIPVVRIIVPGLEAHDEHHRCKPRRRARALARSLQ